MVTDAYAVDTNGYPVKRTNHKYARGVNRPGGAFQGKATEDSKMTNIVINEKEIKKYYVPRASGKSEFSFRQVREYLQQLVEFYLYKFRWLRFGIVGAVGAVVHLAVLYGLSNLMGLWYIASGVIAVLAAATTNYILNHIWTFKERKIDNLSVGWLKYLLLAGLMDGTYIGLLAFFTEVVGLWYMLSAALSLLIIFPVRYNIARLWIWGDWRLSRLITSKHPDDVDYEWYAFTRGSPVQKWWKQSIAKAVWGLLPEGSEVLNIGCGSSPIMAKYSGVGIDSNEGKVEFMRANFCNQGSCEFIVGQAEALHFKANSFDAILCIEVIEHISEPAKVIAEIARVAKANAKVVLATPDYSKVLAYVVDILTPYGTSHTYRFTKRKLERLCITYGLKPVKHKYVGGCDLVELFEKQ